MAGLARFVLEFHANVRIYHWSTTHYARHVASGELVDAIERLGDRIVEAALGRRGRQSLAGVASAPLTLRALDEASFPEYLSKIGDALLGEAFDSAEVAAARDELIAEIAKARYLCASR